MRRSLTGAVALAAAFAASAAGQPEAAQGPLKAGDNLPGPFHPFNVTGNDKDRFHDLVSDYGLGRVVAVFAPEVPGRDSPLGRLLVRLDDAIEASPRGSLHAFAVFVPEGLPDVVQDDDARTQLAKKVADFAVAEPPLRHVVLALDSKADVKAYPLGKDAPVAVVYDRYKVLSVTPIPEGEAGAKAVDALVADLYAKFKLKKPKK